MFRLWLLLVLLAWPAEAREVCMLPPSLWDRAPISVGSAQSRWLEVKDFRSGIKLPLDLDEINRFVHRKVRYTRDRVDEWSRPSETLERGYGDCEDFALLKRALYLEAGGKEEDTCFLIVWDQIARSQHAVLLVNEHGWKLLDSYTSLVMPAEEVRDYTPQFAYMGDDAWFYDR